MTNTNDRADVAAERQAFDEWWFASDRFEYGRTSNAWDGWLARAAISSAVPDGGKGEAVYQQRDHEEHDVWRDVPKKQYDGLIGTLRRIVYTAPQAECAPRAKPFVMDLLDVVEMWNSTTADSFEGQLIELAAKAINFYKDTLPGSAIEQAVNGGRNGEAI